MFFFPYYEEERTQKPPSVAVTLNGELAMFLLPSDTFLLLSECDATEVKIFFFNLDHGTNINPKILSLSSSLLEKFLPLDSIVITCYCCLI